MSSQASNMETAGSGTQGMLPPESEALNAPAPASGSDLDLTSASDTGTEAPAFEDEMLVLAPGSPAGGASAHPMQALARLAAHLMAEPDPKRTYHAIQLGARRLLGADHIVLLGATPSCDRVECLTTVNLPESLVEALVRRPSLDPTWKWLMPLEVAVLEDVALDPRLGVVRDGLLAAGIRSAIVVPLPYRNWITGSLVLFYDNPKRLSPYEWDVLRLYATLAAAAVENSRVHTISYNRAERLRVLNEIGVAVSSVLDLEGLYEVVCQQTSRVLKVDAFYIALWNRERETISYPYATDSGTREVLADRPLGGGPCSWVIRHQEPILANTEAEIRGYGGATYGNGVYCKSAIIVPMLLGEDVIGVMSVQTYEQGAYTAEDVQMLQTVAGQAAVAVENARLYKAVQDASLTDELTGLPNRRAVRRRLVEEVGRAAHPGYQLSVLMLDLDHFKTINDTHGHPMGDAVLKELSILLRGSLRVHDTLGRWGGEEFLIILDHTDRLGGQVVAENLRRVVEIHTFMSGRLGIPLSVSVGGMALQHPHSADATRLLDIVDACLYRAKSAGRNRIVFWPADEISEE